MSFSGTQAEIWNELSIHGGNFLQRIYDGILVTSLGPPTMVCLLLVKIGVVLCTIIRDECLVDYFDLLSLNTNKMIGTYEVSCTICSDVIAGMEMEHNDFPCMWTILGDR